MGNMTVQVKRPNQEITVNVTDMDNLEIMKFLRDVLAGDATIANVPITNELKVTQDETSTKVEYPTSKNLLEPTEDNLTTPLPRLTDVLIDVNCPKCEDTYQRVSKVGRIISCRKCGKTLFTEPGIEGRYKAVKVFK